MENTSSSSYTSEVPALAPMFDKNIKLTLRIVIQVVVMVFGVPGNGLILLVYKNKRQKTSTHVFIIALAMADLSVSLMRILDIVDECFRWAGNRSVKAINLLRPLEYTAVGTTIIVTALIAADRYDCVCRPLRRFFSWQRARRAALASLLTSLAVNIPALIEEIIKTNGLTLIVFVLAFQLLAYIMNLILIIVCYRLVYITIRKHVQVGIAASARGENSVDVAYVSNPHSTGRVSFPSQQGLSTSGNTNKEHNVTNISNRVARISSSEGIERATINALGSQPERCQRAGQFRGKPKRNAPASLLQRKTTKMLFIASVVFLLTWMPYWIFVGKILLREMGVRINPVFSIVTDEARSLVYLNNVVNPLIYGYSNSRFRKDSKVILKNIRCF